MVLLLREIKHTRRARHSHLLRGQLAGHSLHGLLPGPESKDVTPETAPPTANAAGPSKRGCRNALLAPASSRGECRCRRPRVPEPCLLQLCLLGPNDLGQRRCRQKYNSALLVVAVATVGPRALCQRAKVRETIRSTIPARTSGSRATPHECWRRPQGANNSEQSQATYNEPCLLQLFPVVVVVEEVVVVIVLVIQKK